MDHPVIGACLTSKPIHTSWYIYSFRTIGSGSETALCANGDHCEIFIRYVEPGTVSYQVNKIEHYRCRCRDTCQSRSSLSGSISHPDTYNKLRRGSYSPAIPEAEACPGFPCKIR